MSRRHVLLLSGLGLLLLAVVLLTVVRYVPEDEIALIRTGDSIQRVPPGFLVLNPLSERLERIPASRFEVHGISNARSTDGFAVRLPFTAAVRLRTGEFQAVVDNLGDAGVEERVQEILERILAAWASTFPASTFLRRDLTEAAAIPLRSTAGAGGIEILEFTLQPPDRDLYLFLAEDALSRGDPGDRLALIEEGLEQYPDDWRLITARGMLLEAIGLWETAEAEYLRALEVAPGSEPPLSRLYLGLQKQGQVFRLEKLLLDALGANAESTKIRTFLALTYVAQERYADALRHLEEARRRAPRDESILTNLGGVLQEVGRYDEAVEMYTAALAETPGDRRIRFNLGLAELSRGDLPAARRALEEARGAGPPSARVLNVLGEAYRQSGMDDEARETLQASYDLNPEQPGLRDALTHLLGHPPE